MAENFVDNIAYGQSALSISGDALVIGATNTNATSKSIFFNNNSTSGQLVWGPSANRTISLPDANGVVMLTSQGVLSLSAGTTQLTSGQVVFSNSNGVSFGVNGQTVTGSIATSLTNVNFSAGTTSNNLSAVTFSNSNGISFGLNGSTLTGSVATSLTNVNFSAGTTSNNLSAITFSNSNGISFGLNGSTLTGSVATSLTNVNFSAGTTSNNLSAVTFSNANGVSFGLNGSTITASVAAGAVNFSAGTTSNNLNSITFSNSNGISFGLNGSTLTGSVATSLTGVNLSAGTTSNNLSAFVFSNSNNVSFGLNGSTVTATISVPAQTSPVVSYLNQPESPWQTNFTVSNATMSFQPFKPRANITATQANMLMALAGHTNSSGALTISLGIYTFLHSTLSLASSNSVQISWTSGSQTTTGTIYGGVSGTQYRTVSLNNWAISGGDYVLGVWCRTTNDGIWMIYGSEGPSIANALDPAMTLAYLPGISSVSYSTAMQASVNVTDPGYLRISGDALKQAGMIFMGSY